MNLALPILSPVTCKSTSQAPTCIQAESKHRITCNQPHDVTSHAQQHLHFNSCYPDQDNLDRKRNIHHNATSNPPSNKTIPKHHHHTHGNNPPTLPRNPRKSRSPQRSSRNPPVLRAAILVRTFTERGSSISRTKSRSLLL